MLHAWVASLIPHRRRFSRREVIRHFLINSNINVRMSELSINERLLNLESYKLSIEHSRKYTWSSNTKETIYFSLWMTKDQRDHPCWSTQQFQIHRDNLYSRKSHVNWQFSLVQILVVYFSSLLLYWVGWFPVIVS